MRNNQLHDKNILNGPIGLTKYIYQMVDPKSRTLQLHTSPRRCVRVQWFMHVHFVAQLTTMMH